MHVRLTESVRPWISYAQAILRRYLAERVSYVSGLLKSSRVVARYELDFVHRFVETGDVRSIHLSQEFNTLREEIREILHRDHSKTELHA